jgi:diguanylate cyclase
MFTNGGAEFSNLWVTAGLFGLTAAVGLSESLKTELRAQKKLLDSYLAEARSDPLTGVANRCAFEFELHRSAGEAKTQNKPLSLLLIDMDHFQQLNDMHGHQAGDEMLRAVARILRGKAGGQGIPTRYGGQQFAVILPDMALDKAVAFAELIRAAVEKCECSYRSGNLTATVSIGVVQAAADQSPDKFVAHADNCLCQAKQAGCNCIVAGEDPVPGKPVPQEHDSNDEQTDERFVTA